MGDVQRFQRAPDGELGLALHPDIDFLIHLAERVQEAIWLRGRSNGELRCQRPDDVLVLLRVVGSGLLEKPYPILNVQRETPHCAVHLRPLRVDVQLGLTDGS